MKKIVFILLFHLVIYAAAQNTSTIIVKSKPWKTFPIHARSPLEIETNLHYDNNFKTDKDGNFKIQFAIEKPFLVELSNFLDYNDHYIFLAQKNRTYTIDASRKDNPITCNVDSLTFLNEIDFYTRLDGEHSLNHSPQYSNDTVNSSEQKLRDISIRLGGSKKGIDSSMKYYGYQFDKPINSETEYFAAIENYYNTRMLELEESRSSKLLSSGFYTFYKRFFYLRFLQDKINIRPLGKTFKYASTQLKIDEAYTEIEKLFACDSCTDFMVFREIMDKYLHRKIYKESNYRTISEDIYDYVNNENKFSRKVKDFLLTNIINDEIFVANANTHSKYLGKYFVDCTSEFYKNVTKNRAKRQEDYLPDETCKSIMLEQPNGLKVSLYDVLQKHKGKAVYIDLWASWCSPCMVNMFHSRNLAKASEKSNFVVLFFSLDNDKTAWTKASTQEQINTSNNYLLVNDKQSKLCDLLDIFEIPRFILFGKNGKLLVMKAIDAYSMYDKKFYE